MREMQTQDIITPLSNKSKNGMNSTISISIRSAIQKYKRKASEAMKSK